MAAPDRRSFLLALVAIMLLAGVLRLYGIAEQPPLADEVSAAVSAGNYMEKGQFGPTMWYHPNLRNIGIYSVGRIFGYTPYSLRGISLVTGTLTVLLAGMCLYVLTGDTLASMIVMFLMAIEQVHITFSRQAIQETWTTFFFLLGLLFAVLYRKKDKPLLLILAGIVFGLGIASKFHALPPLAVTLCAGLYLAGKERSLSRGLFAFACLVLLPAIVYLLTYIPWYGRGYGMAEWLQMQKVLFAKMMSHTGNPMDQRIDTQAWQWFLRPMGYANFVFFGGRPFVTVAFSNPLLWIAVLPAAVHAAWRLIRGNCRRTEEARGIFFVLALFVISYAPLALSPRPLWLLSSLAVLPFAFMLVALALSSLWRTFAWGRKAVAGYLLLVLTVSLALYPMAVGRAKKFSYLAPVAERFRPPFEQKRIPTP